MQITTPHHTKVPSADQNLKSAQARVEQCGQNLSRVLQTLRGLLERQPELQAEARSLRDSTRRKLGAFTKGDHSNGELVVCSIERYEDVLASLEDSQDEPRVAHAQRKLRKWRKRLAAYRQDPEFEVVYLRYRRRAATVARLTQGEIKRRGLINIKAAKTRLKKASQEFKNVWQALNSPAFRCKLNQAPCS
jgi:hypothetical protein